MITVDFETEAIQDRPNYPPVPVGCAVEMEDGTARYFAWGHPKENNCEKFEFVNFITPHWRDFNLLFHNAQFDMDVAMVHLGLPLVQANDTLPLLFFNNPYAKTLSLKPSAEALLNLPPTEQTELKDWIRKNVHGVKEGKEGAHICKAPGDLVGRYAVGDVVRTAKLYNHLDEVRKLYEEPYAREIRLTPALIRMTTLGVRVNREGLIRDTETTKAVYEETTLQLQKLLGPINPDSPKQLIPALLALGCVEERKLHLTPKGALSASAESLDSAWVEGNPVTTLFRYHSAIGTLLSTFLGPWVEFSSKTGRLHASYNAVRGDWGGARTGRLSSYAPNFQNIPKSFKLEVPTDLPAIPNMRNYLLPDDGLVWLTADFKSQEPRLAAHFCGGNLERYYLEDPETDIYTVIMELVRRLSGLEVDRSTVKILFLGLIYGMGAKAIGETLKVDYDEAIALKKALFAAVPEVKVAMAQASNAGRVVTLGGRTIYKEVSETGGNYGYKLFNALIQGSAADQIKEMIVGCDKTGLQLLSTVHDEVNLQCEEDEVDDIANLLHGLANCFKTDVEFLLSVETGGSYGTCK